MPERLASTPGERITARERMLSWSVVMLKQPSS